MSEIYLQRNQPGSSRCQSKAAPLGICCAAVVFCALVLTGCSGGVGGSGTYFGGSGGGENVGAVPAVSPPVSRAAVIGDWSSVPVTIFGPAAANGPDRTVLFDITVAPDGTLRGTVRSEMGGASNLGTLTGICNEDGTFTASLEHSLFSPFTNETINGRFRKDAQSAQYVMHFTADAEAATSFQSPSLKGLRLFLNPR